MSFPNRVKVPVAIDSRSNLSMYCQHITTNDFMEFTVAKSFELVPGQSIDITHSCFSRLEPMPVPTFGRAVIKNRAYFVPFRTVWPAWQDFIDDLPHNFENYEYQYATNAPATHISIFLDILRTSTYSTSVSSGYDFNYVQYDSSGVVIAEDKRKFTKYGKIAYKLLLSLGYKFNFTNRGASKMVSLLPLYCAFRVYLDYYYSTQYANDSYYNSIFQFINNNTWFDDGDYVSGTLVQDLGVALLEICKVYYDADYFTSAWDNPNAPNNGLYSRVKINDISNDFATGVNSNVVSNSSNTVGDASTPRIYKDSSINAVGPITKYTLKALNSLSDYLKRNQLAGSRVIDRYLARFGYKLKNEKLNRSVYVGEFVQDIQFGDVVSTSSTDGASLGSYAGKGLSYGQGHFEYSTDEYGMLIIVSTIIPETQYYEGISRNIFHLSKLDFWTPEFDALGVQAISKCEVYVPVDGTEMTSNDYYNEVFGFVPRYAEYKTTQSLITGDYSLQSVNVGKDSWNLMRSVKGYFQGGIDDFVHSQRFVDGIDSEQYNRIFYIPEGTDNFNVIHDFNIKSSFPGKSLYDTYEFENEDDANKVTMQVGGSQVN